ncbi:16875_t:CDS:1, partial [Funneliformis caledonium]
MDLVRKGSLRNFGIAFCHIHCHKKRERKRNASEAFENDFDYLFGTNSCLYLIRRKGFIARKPKPLVYLTCKHIVHYNCINNPQKLCPICPSANVTETDDMETDDDEIVTNNFETQGSSTTQNKCTMNPASTEKSSNKKQKTSTNDGESPTLKRLIKELKTPSSA